MKPRRLLVVDDDPATLASIRDLFRRAGFDVETAATGRDALAHLLDAEVPSAVVLDSRMPVMSGGEFVSVVRAYSRLSTVPILLLSAWETPKPLAEHVDAIMRKPFTAEELIANVEAIIRR